jgi:hypothetical protein
VRIIRSQISLINITLNSFQSYATCRTWLRGGTVWKPDTRYRSCIDATLETSNQSKLTVIEICRGKKLSFWELVIFKWNCLSYFDILLFINLQKSFKLEILLVTIQYNLSKLTSKYESWYQNDLVLLTENKKPLTIISLEIWCKFQISRCGGWPQ